MPKGKPNIVVFWGDDIGITNLSCYSDGLMATGPQHRPPADEGMRFTDSYGEQSCTAGRSAFITGQSVYRTGLSKVGLPGAEQGLQAEDPTIAEALKPLKRDRNGKNHLGDRDEHLPTAHGFDEFFGNLYHLNAEEELEHPDYPDPRALPGSSERYGPRGVLHSKMTSGGRHTIKDTGPLTRKRMETIDDEIVDGAIDFIQRKHNARTPSSPGSTPRMHFRDAHQAPEPRAVWPLAVPVPRHDDRPRQARAGCSTRSTSSTSPRTRSSCTDRQRRAHELLAGRRHDAVPLWRRTRTGRAPSGFPSSSAGRGGSPPGWSPTRS